MDYPLLRSCTATHSVPVFPRNTQTQYSAEGGDGRSEETIRYAHSSIEANTNRHISPDPGPFIQIVGQTWHRDLSWKKQGLPDSIAVGPDVLAKPQIHPAKYEDNTTSKEYRGRSANGKRFGRYNRRVKKETPT